MSSQSMHAETYFEEGAGIRSWLLTTDHKRIAWLYLVSITVFCFVGGAAAARPPPCLPSRLPLDRLGLAGGTLSQLVVLLAQGGKVQGTSRRVCGVWGV